MTDAEADISDTLKAKSDQLNADELLAGPITVTIADVKRFSDDKQPLGLSIGQTQADGKDKPFKPCKTVRRLLVAMWHKDPRVWIGRSLRLMRDPTVVYSGKTLGGIRIDAASHITKAFEMTLTEVRGKPKTFTIQPLKTSTAGTKSDPPKQEATQMAAVTTESFKAMKAAWQAGVKAIGGVMNEVTFRSFVDATTGGIVSAAGAMNPQSYSVSTLAKCLDAAVAMMPRGDDVPFE